MVVSAKGLGLYQPEITNDNYVLLGTLSFITNDDVAIAVTTVHCSTHSATITITVPPLFHFIPLTAMQCLFIPSFTVFKLFMYLN